MNQGQENENECSDAGLLEGHLDDFQLKQRVCLRNSAQDERKSQNSRVTWPTLHLFGRRDETNMQKFVSLSAAEDVVPKKFTS